VPLAAPNFKIDRAKANAGAHEYVRCQLCHGLAAVAGGDAPDLRASSVPLVPDAFSTIVKAVHWGRSLYENIQRFIQFQLTINVSALAIARGVNGTPSVQVDGVGVPASAEAIAAIASLVNPPHSSLPLLPPSPSATPPGVATHPHVDRKATIPTTHPEFARSTAAPTTMPCRPNTLPLVRRSLQLLWSAAPFPYQRHSST